MKAVILAGGTGSRLKSCWAGIPKSMLPLFDRPAVEYLIKRLARCGITEILMSVSRETPEIAKFLGNGSRYGVKLAYSVESEPMGTAGAVRAFSHILDDPFIVVSGDCATDIDFAQIVELHLDHRSIASIVAASVNDNSEFGAMELDSENRLRRFIEKPSDTENLKSDLVSTGIYIFEPEILGSIPPYTKCDFALDVFPRLLSNSETVRGIKLQGYWQDIGLMLGYRDAHMDALTGAFRIDIPAEPAGPGIYIGADAQIGDMARISAPVYIGARTSIGDAARVQSRSIIGAESLVGANSQIANTILGMGSVVGADSRISGSILAGSGPVDGNSQIFGCCRISEVNYLPEKAVVRQSAPHIVSRVIIPA